MKPMMILILAGQLATAASTPAIRPGQWSVEFEVVEVSTDLHPQARSWIGHRWGGDTCLTPDAESAAIVLDTPYRCEVHSFSADRQRLIATRVCSGGHMIPGRGVETIVASIQNERISGVSDITLVSDPNAGLTRIRSVMVAQRTGDCSG